MSGRHRDPGLARRTRAVIVVIVMLAGLAGFGVWRTVGNDACTGELELTVAAAPEIAPALRDAANRWAVGAQSRGGRCVAVSVVPASAAEVALAITSNVGVVLTGLSTAATGSPAPSGSGAPGPTVTPRPSSTVAVPSLDVWVPDSSTWLVRVRTAAPSLVPQQAQSVASSPVVLALPEPTATAMGWPGQVPSWDAILQMVTGGAPGTGLRLGVVDPNRDAVGLTSLAALGAAAATMGPAADQATVAIMRALFLGRSPTEADLVAKFPTADDPETLASSLGAAPLSERSVVAYNAKAPAVKLAPLYVQPAPPALDYPFAVMPGISDDRAQLAEELRAALAGAEFEGDLAAAGLRRSDGSAAFTAIPTAPALVDLATQLDGSVVSRAITTWITVTRPARMLAVIDVSGSMALPMPGGGGLTRSDVAQAAARQGVGLFDDSWSVGLWAFSTNLTSTTDYKEILPIRPMSVQRPLLLAAIDTVQPVPGSGTGLYDTVLAAYQAVQAGWDPAAVNSVVLLTDGRNDDANGITLEQLVATLKTLHDPRYPIQVVAIGFGEEVSRDELETITATTGGAAFIAYQASEILPIFLQALSVRPAG